MSAGRVPPPASGTRREAGEATVRQLEAWGTERLALAGCVSARAEARWLVAEALGERQGGPAPRGPVAPDGRERFEAMVARRAGGEPLQYVIGWAPFGPLRLAVGPGVFVPRPETESLAERAAMHLRAADGRDGRVAVDLCTGSGAIACYLAEAVPSARVVATELDPEAVGWARRNAAGRAVEVLEGDFDEPLPAELAGRVDVLTANVPYVPSGQIALLPSDVREHEPLVALDGGADGLDLFRRLLGRAGRWLRDGGWLLSEIGDDQGASAIALARAAGLVDVAIRADLADRDRVLEGQWRRAKS